MNILEALHRIRLGLGDNPVVRLEIGDYEEGALETLTPTQSRLVVIKDGVWLSWTIEQKEWESPEPLINIILVEAPRMILQEIANRKAAKQ